MYARSNSAGGFYEPSFLYMFLDTDEDLRKFPKESDNERAEALFLHEYIHYIQDLTCTYSFALTSTFVDQMLWAVDKGHEMNPITVPMEPLKEVEYHISDNEISRRLTVGGGPKENIQISDIIKLSVTTETITLDGQTKDVPLKFVMNFFDQSRNEQSFVIGSHAIMESMAYLIERKIYGNILGKPSDLPYNVVQKVIEFDCPKYSDEDSMIIICDVCLMHPFPGIALSNLLSILRQIDNKLNPEEIFYLGVSERMLKNSGVNKEWKESFIETHEIAKKQLEGYFNFEGWSENREVVGILFNNACKLRIQDPLFILKLAQGGKIKGNAIFANTYSQLGFICAITADHRVYSLPPAGFNKEIEQDLFVCLHQCFRILLRDDVFKNYDTKRCELLERCHKSYIDQKLNERGYKDLTVEDNEFCKHFPWKQTSNDALNQCAFGRMWTIFGLKDKEVIGIGN